jgi:hypothetical protein
MKLAQQWRNFAKVGLRLCQHCESLPFFTPLHTTRTRIARSPSPSRNQTQQCRISTPLQATHTTCSSRHYVPPAPIYGDDPFQAQLLAYRDQSWWNANQENNDVPAGEGMPILRPAYSKRSLSIREIRERMNSDQLSMKSFESVAEFEPGLRLLDKGYGTWEDMEMFID